MNAGPRPKKQRKSLLSTKRKGGSDLNAGNKRDFPRSNTLLPFKARRLDVGKSDAPQSRVSIGHIVIDNFIPPETADERLNVWLNMINSKLDYLISLDTPKTEESLYLTFEPLNISGSGMMMATKNEFHVGDILEIQMVLENYPAKILYLYGEVIRIEQIDVGSGIKTVAVKFLNLNEEVRDEITRFDLKKYGRRITGKI